MSINEELKPKKSILKSHNNLDNTVLLPYHFKKQSTSEDPSFPLSNLEKRDISNGGWISKKSCKYPQKLIVKFERFVNIRQINLLINESKIPTKIQFINCIQIKETETDNENSSHHKGKYHYENIGFVTLSSKDDNNYKNREFREIRLDINNTKRIKLLIYENYKNSENNYNQVGIVSLEFFGTVIENENTNEEYEYEELDEEEEEEEDDEEEPIIPPKEEKKEKKIEEKKEELPKENNQPQYIEVTVYEEEEEEEDDDAVIPQKEEAKKVEEIKLKNNIVPVEQKKEEKNNEEGEEDEFELVYEEEEEEEEEEKEPKKADEIKNN